MASWMQGMTVGWVVYSTTGSAFLLGLAASARGLSPLVLALFAGSLVDRFPRRRLLIVTHSIIVTCAVTLAVLLAVGWTPIPALITLELISSGAMLFDMTARSSSIPALAERRDLLSALALMSACLNGTGVVGPGLAGTLIEWLGALGAVVVLAAAYSVALFVTTTIPFPKIQPPTPQPVLASIRDGLRYVRSSPVLFGTVVLMAAIGIVGRPYPYMLPAFATDVLQAGAAGLGALGSANGLGALVGAFVASGLGRVRARGWLTLGSFVAMGLSLAAFAFASTFGLAVALITLPGFWLSIAFAAGNATMQSRTSDEMRSRVSALYILIVMGLGQVGSILLGGIAQPFGVGTALAVAGGAIVLLTAVTIARSPAIRREVAA